MSNVDLFGWGNCYGFVGVFNGLTPPDPSPDKNLQLSPVLDFPGEGDFGTGGYEAGSHLITELPANPTPATLDVPIGIIAPQEGLLNYLTSGEVPVESPQFGHVALFRRGNGQVQHAAIVLGENSNGDVFILQKYNQAQPYGISMVTGHPAGYSETGVEYY